MTPTVAFFVGYFVGAAAVLFAVAFGQASKEQERHFELTSRLDELEQRDGTSSDVISLNRHRRRLVDTLAVLLAVSLLAGCVRGDPYDPADECPDVTIYVSLDTTTQTLELDSLARGCTDDDK